MQKNSGGSAERWTRRAGWIALVVTLLIPASSLVRPYAVDDFAQIYMGGLMARLDSSQMYPIPKPGSTLNAGWTAGSDLPPRYAAEAEARHIENANRYILPPPSAILFIPFSYLPYRVAFVVWQILLALACWRLAVLAGEMHVILTGRATRATVIVVLLVAISPLTWRTMRCLEISPLVGYCLACATFGLWQGRSALAGAGLIGAILTKYIGVMLLPLAVIQRRWKALAWFAAVTAALVGGAWLLMGTQAYDTYLHQIGPTLKRPAPQPLNQSIQGLLLRLTHRDALTPAMSLGVRIAALACLAIVLMLLWRGRQAIRTQPAAFFAAAVLLTLNLLLFSPINWDNYFIYLCPWWGYLLWEAGRSKMIAAGAILAIAATWMPWCSVRGGHLPIPEPFMSHMLLGGILIALIAARRLWLSASSGQATIADTDLRD